MILCSFQMKDSFIPRRKLPKNPSPTSGIFLGPQKKLANKILNLLSTSPYLKDHPRHVIHNHGDRIHPLRIGVWALFVNGRTSKPSKMVVNPNYLRPVLGWPSNGMNFLLRKPLSSNAPVRAESTANWPPVSAGGSS